MRTRVQGSRFLPFPRGNFHWTGVPDIARNRVGADAAQTVGDRLGIAKRSEEGLHTGGGKSWKEVLQVKVQYHGLAGVRRGESHDRTFLDRSEEHTSELQSLR